MTTPSRECKCSEEAMCLQGSKSHLVREVNIGDVPQIFVFFLSWPIHQIGGGGRGGVYRRTLSYVVTMISLHP